MKIKTHWPTITIAGFWIAGCLKSFILPWLKYWYFPDSWVWLRVPEWMAHPGDPAVLLFGLLTVIGFIVFLAQGNRLVERRESGHLAFLGFVILIGGLYAFTLDAFHNGLIQTLYDASETPFWAISLGLAMAFYKLEDAKSLLIFFVPMGLCFLFPVNISLIRHFAPDLVAGTLLENIQHFTFPDAFSDPWFWSDSFVDYFILPYFLFWVLVRKEGRFRNPYLAKRFVVDVRKFLTDTFILVGVAGAVVIAIMFAEPALRKFYWEFFVLPFNGGEETEDYKPSRPINGESDGSDGGTVRPRGGCPPNTCWSNGYCCPETARYYCNGGCYQTMSQAVRAGGAQCATYRIICD